MSRSTLSTVLFALVLLLATTVGMAAVQPMPDPDRERLQAELAALNQDPALADMAALERFRAGQMITALPSLRSRDRAQAVMLAELWVETAKTAAQAQLLQKQSRQLDSERDQIMLEASRREAALARREADRLQLQNLAQQEAAERLSVTAEANRQAGEQAAADAEAATAEAAQARKLADAREHEAVLAREEARLASQAAGDDSDIAPLPASRKVAGKTVYTLSGTAFASGSAGLTDSAKASLRRLAAALPASVKLKIEGHTDNQGKADANLALSQQRADAVRQALLAVGIAPARVSALGKGQADPLGDNHTPGGRARNRRVELIVQ